MYGKNLDAEEALVGDDGVGLRVDAGLSRLFPRLSRSKAERLLKSGRVRLDGDVVTRKSTKLRAGQYVRIEPLDDLPDMLDAEAIDFDVVYEDGDVAVVYKPAGMVVHPATSHWSGTLANALLHRFGPLPTAGGERHSGLVHRLDRDTSGLLVVAKTEAALANLLDQFKSRKIDKRYLALVRGAPPERGIIDEPLGRDPTDHQRMAIVLDGKQAVTSFGLLQQYHRCALVLVHLETGRTHQIRAHFAAIGHPIIGDQIYGGGSVARADANSQAVSRQWLHAWRIVFRQPTSGNRITCEARLPEDLIAVLASLGDPDPDHWAPRSTWTVD